MELKKVIIFTAMSVAMTTLVLSAPTSPQSGGTTPQNQTSRNAVGVNQSGASQSGGTTPQNQTRRNAVGVNQSGAPPGLMQLRMTGFEWKIKGMIEYYARSANKLIIEKYPFIDRPFLNSPMTRLRLITLKAKARLCPKMSLNYKLGILHPQFATFRQPLDLVYKYELNQNPKSTQLVHALKLTKNYVDETVADIRKVYPNNLVLPLGRTITESELDSMTNKTLSLYQIRTQVAPTPANVKIYRNFVIVNTLVLAIRLMDPCIP